MFKSLSFINYKIEKLLPFLGIFFVLLGFLPFLILGEGSVLTTHDQFDGELLAYLLHGSYFGTGVDVFPEWMGGVAQTSLTPPAFLPILFFKILPPLQAFLANQFLVALTAFLGMYYFLKKLLGAKQNLVLFIIALCFSYLPFYSMYGVCVAGIPFLFYAIWELSDGKNPIKNLFFVLYYGLMSSFVLVGYAVVGILFFYSIFLLLKKKKAKWVILATFGLTLYYIGTNMDLVLQVLGMGESMISHKTELVLTPLAFWQSTFDLFLNGSGHAPSFHKWMIFPILVTLLYYGRKFRFLNKPMKNQYVLLCSLFGVAVFISLFYGFYHFAPIITLRNKIGGPVVYFQLDRIYWFYPFLWYTMLAVMIYLFLNGQKEQGKKQSIVIVGITSVCLIFVIGTVLWNSDFKKNIRQIVNPIISNSITWEKYFGEPIFEQIKTYIGKDQSTYRVGSIGLHPAAAAYNGFYTIDGYSNNYELSYKQEFRKIIAGELDKNQELKTYFDDWGNRCYLFSAELGMNYYFNKEAGTKIRELDFNTEQLKKMGCEFIFSTVLIENAESLGFVLEDRFETDQSGTYCIYLYSLHE